MSKVSISGGIEEDGRIFIVRHAESAANAGGRTADPATIPITETGARQAQQVANVISTRPAVIVVSRYLRTVQTDPTFEAVPRCAGGTLACRGVHLSRYRRVCGDDVPR